MASLQADLHDIKNTLESSVKKTDMQKMVTTIMGKLLNDQRVQIIYEISEKLRENTGKLQDQIDTLFIENNNLKENLREKDRVIKQLQDSASESQYKASEAVRLGNFNEQYSRKHNIRILNLPEKRDENLHHEFTTIVKKDLNIDIEESDVLAIHRLPGRGGQIKPAIVKVRNTDIKKQIMRKKKELKNNIRLHDDITQRDLKLMSRLRENKELESVWFYNCSVYAKKPNSDRKIKFDLYDDINEKLRR